MIQIQGLSFRKAENNNIRAIVDIHLTGGQEE